MATSTLLTILEVRAVLYNEAVRFPRPAGRKLSASRNGKKITNAQTISEAGATVELEVEIVFTVVPANAANRRVVGCPFDLRAER